MEKKKLPGITDWIKESLRIYFKKDNFIYLTKFALLMLLLQGIFLLLMYFIITPVISPIIGPILDPNWNGQFDFQALKPFIGPIAVGIIILVAFGTWISAAMQKAVSKVADANKPSVREVLSGTLSRVPAYIATSILMGLIVFIGFLLLVIPGVIFMVWFYFATFFVVLEKSGPINALKKSRELVKGYFWPVVGRTAVFFAYTWVLGKLVSALFYPLIETIIWGVASPYFVLLPYLVFRDLKKIKSAKE